MLPGLEMMAACTDLAVPGQLMQHVAQVESSHNPYAIGVVGGRLVRQPRNLAEAVSTAQMLEQQGRNFSVGLVQVNRYNLAKQGLGSYEQAFDVCSNVRAGSRILAECHARAGQDWGKAFSCYYSGNFTRGFKPDVIGKPSYVQKVLASAGLPSTAIPVVPNVQTGNGPKPQFDKAAGDTSPVTLKPQATQPAALPPDHAPVLLRPSNAGSGSAVRLQPLATGAAGGQPEGVTNETPADKPAPASSVIVF